MTLKTMLRAAALMLFVGTFTLGCEPTDTETPADVQVTDAAEADVVAPADETTDDLVGELTEEAEATASDTETADADALPETNYYAIDTPQGRMVVRLYDETPQHRDNFKKLVAEGTLDDTQFHRIIKGFMIQGGDPNSKDDDPMDDGQGGPGYTVPAEIVPGLFHKKGALSAARQADQVNPERRSSGSQFYIVQGSPLSEGELDEIQAALRQRIPDPDFTFSPEARAAYMNEGGTPFLDRQYTVFGELVEGEAILDAIADTPTPRAQGQSVHPALADHPAEPVRMTVTPLPDYE